GAGDPAPLSLGHPRPVRPGRRSRALVVDGRCASLAGAGREADRPGGGTPGPFCLGSRRLPWGMANPTQEAYDKIRANGQDNAGRGAPVVPGHPPEAGTAMSVQDSPSPTQDRPFTVEYYYNLRTCSFH